MKPAKVNLASNLPNPAPPRPQQRADSNPPGRDNAPTRNTVLKKPARRRATPARHTGVSTPFTASAVQVLVRCSAVHNNWVVTSYRMKNSDAPCAQLLVLPPCPWYVSVSGGRFLLFPSLFDHATTFSRWDDSSSSSSFHCIFQGERRAGMAPLG